MDCLRRHVELTLTNVAQNDIPEIVAYISELKNDSEIYPALADLRKKLSSLDSVILAQQKSSIDF